MTPELSESQVAAKGRELEAERWDLPKRFRLQAELLALPPEELKERDPEMFRLWERVQADEKRLAAAAAMPMGQMSSQDVFRARAAQRAEEHRQTIYRLDQEIGRALTSGAGDVEELQRAKIAVRRRRAEQLSLLGRFDLASQEAPDPQTRAHYLDILEAVWKPDDEWCDCPDIRGSGEQADLTAPSQYVKEEVFSIKDGRMVFLLACAKCSTLNAVPNLPARLSQQRAHRQRARQVAGDVLSPTEAATALTRAGHTTKALLK